MIAAAAAEHVGDMVEFDVGEGDGSCGGGGRNTAASCCSCGGCCYHQRSHARTTPSNTHRETSS